ncbi:MAG: gamma-glutamyltransferase family protein [Acidobacteria bacterium]|nr:gamma-glutamyltransferase family protein [Acidobacteriota bacterium]
MKVDQRFFAVLSLCLLGPVWGVVPLDAGTRPLIMGTRGVVVSGHHQASDAGLTMLKKGGNAADAGVATVFAQAVVEFDRFGIGGEVPLLIYLADQKKVVAISGHGVAPRAATIEWFRSRNIDLVPMDGFLPATVPAVVDSLILALDHYGTLSLAEVLAPAIDLAERGFAVHPEFKMHIEEQEARFRSEWTTSGKVFLPAGKVPEIGDLFVQSDLARTLKRLVEAEAAHKQEGRSEGLKAARDLFYEGEMAEEIVAFQKNFKSRDANGFVSAGLLEVEDLANFHSRVEEPARTSYRGVDIYKAGFWTQGPVLLQALNILEGYDLKALGHNSPEYIHLLAEAMKLAFADREWYYADPDFVGVPRHGLLSKEYAAKRRDLIDLDHASMTLRPGDPYPFEAQRTEHRPIPETIAFRPGEKGTTGTRVADAEGNVFSATPSGGWFRHSPVIEGLGFVLGTRGQTFWLDEDKANKLEPGKRPLTTLTPSLALKDGKPFLAWGTPGGDVQDQVNLQFLINVIDFGMDIQEAIDAPCFQILDFPSSFYPRRFSSGGMLVENRIDSTVIEKLQAMGHRTNPAGDWSLGDTTALMVDRGRGMLFGAASPRRDKSYALAW